MADGLLEAVHGLHLAHPQLGSKPLLAMLREQQPDLAAGNKEVREALAALKAEESKPTEAAAAAHLSKRMQPCVEHRSAPLRTRSQPGRLAGGGRIMLHSSSSSLCQRASAWAKYLTLAQ